MRRIYLFVYYLTLVLVTVFTSFVFIASHEDTVKYLVDKSVQQTDITYRKVEGSLFTGLTLYDINYSDAVFIKHLNIQYRLSHLLKPRPKINKISIEKSVIVLKNLKKSPDTDEQSESSIFPFSITQLQLSKIKIIDENTSFNIELDASNLSYAKHLSVKDLSLRASTPYADVSIKGNIKNNRLYAKTSIKPDDSFSSGHLTFLHGQIFNLEADKQKISLGTHFDTLVLNAEQNISLQMADIDLIYDVNEMSLTADTSHLLSYKGFETETKHKSLINALGNYHTELKTIFIAQPYPLPFKSFTVSADGNKTHTHAQLDAVPFNFELNSSNYEDFYIKAKAKGLKLTFIDGLPEPLQKELIDLKTSAFLKLSPFFITGDFDGEGIDAHLKGKYEIDTVKQLLTAELIPESKSKIWKDYPSQLFSPLNLTFFNEAQNSIAHMDANKLTLTLFHDDIQTKGWGSLSSGVFTVQRPNTNDANATLTAHIPSVHSFINEIQDKEETMVFDSEIDINTTLELSEGPSIKSRLYMPWYIIKPDTQTVYHGKDLYIESKYTDNTINIEKYRTEIMNHKIYSNRPSKLTIDTNGSIILNKFWIYDKLLLSGKINPSQMQTNLRVQSDNFKYKSKEGNLTLKADVKIDVDKKGEENITGNISLIDGIITYDPPTDYSISDDIIIIQDIKPKLDSQRSLNIYLNALKPIRYKTEEIDLHFSPDILLWQEPDTDLGIYGLISIADGTVTAAGKSFEFDKSEIYFNGSKPMNPHLNLNMHYYTLDGVDIEIYITNTMSSPLVILTSKPVMSQNDIMSYILFGKPASVFDASEETSSGTAAVGSLLLATGLKQMLNDTAGVNIDTLNILTSEEGTFGYEIGTRFTKDIRVLYKNDTISSVILQYSISRSLRFDIDVHETGQGASILYIKDFNIDALK